MPAQRNGRAGLRRRSAATSPRTRAAAPAQAKIPALNSSPPSRTARYSQKSVRSRDWCSASDTVRLSQVLREELTTALRTPRGAQRAGGAALLDRTVMEKQDPVGSLAREFDLVCDDDHGRARFRELAHDV